MRSMLKFGLVLSLIVVSVPAIALAAPQSYWPDYAWAGRLRAEIRQQVRESWRDARRSVADARREAHREMAQARAEHGRAIRDAAREAAREARNAARDLRKHYHHWKD
jgi:hypothetical protein